MSGKFEIGKQPCEQFNQAIDGNGYATWGNEHQCYRCGGLVSFCDNCHRDHHANGYETCQPASDERQTS